MSKKVKANNVKLVTKQKWFYVRCKTFKSHSINCQTVEPAPTLLKDEQSPNKLKCKLSRREKKSPIVNW
jgi:hypothetical protein